MGADGRHRAQSARQSEAERSRTALQRQDQGKRLTVQRAPVVPQDETACTPANTDLRIDCIGVESEENIEDCIALRLFQFNNALGEALVDVN